nr:MAG TPA: helix-turn-helix domain protein [Caudoviricetes sp.]
MLTGKQLKKIRQVADFTATDVADEMFVTKQAISAIETGKTTAKNSVHYYELALKSMIEHIGDCELRSVYQVLFDKYSNIKGEDEDVPIIDGLDKSCDVDTAWYVICEYDYEPMDILYKSIEREKAIDYARDLKRRNPYMGETIKVYHDFDF